MCLAGGLGAALHLGSVPRPAGLDDDLSLLFSESAPRYLLEVAWDDVDSVTRELAGVPHAVVGSLTQAPVVTIGGLTPRPLLQVDLAALTKSFRTGLDF